MIVFRKKCYFKTESEHLQGLKFRVISNLFSKASLITKNMNQSHVNS